MGASKKISRLSGARWNQFAKLRGVSGASPRSFVVCDAMKTTAYERFIRLPARAVRAALLVLLAAGNAASAADEIVKANDEQAVIQTMATLLNQEAGGSYDYLYFESEFPASAHVASSMSNPDRTSFCGLSRDAAQTLVTEITTVTKKPVEFDSSLAKPAGLKIGQKRLPRFRYLTLSRVVFAPSHDQAWLAVDLNGESGAVMRLDKVGGQWSKSARCGGWVKLAE